jgi:hypothetical protein
MKKQTRHLKKNMSGLTADARENQIVPGEKTIDSTPLENDISGDFREGVQANTGYSSSNMRNLSNADDRGEDLATGNDAFMQQPERDTQIPPELIQQRAYELYEQRGAHQGSDLYDWFEAERQLRGEQL